MLPLLLCVCTNVECLFTFLLIKKLSLLFLTSLAALGPVSFVPISGYYGFIVIVVVAAAPNSTSNGQRTSVLKKYSHSCSYPLKLRIQYTMEYKRKVQRPCCGSVEKVFSASSSSSSSFNSSSVSFYGRGHVYCVHWVLGVPCGVCVCVYQEAQAFAFVFAHILTNTIVWCSCTYRTAFGFFKTLNSVAITIPKCGHTKAKNVCKIGLMRTTHLHSYLSL